MYIQILGHGHNVTHTYWLADGWWFRAFQTKPNQTKHNRRDWLTWLTEEVVASRTSSNDFFPDKTSAWSNTDTHGCALRSVNRPTPTCILIVLATYTHIWKLATYSHMLNCKIMYTYSTCLTYSTNWGESLCFSSARTRMRMTPIYDKQKMIKDNKKSTKAWGWPQSAIKQR